MNGLPTLGAFVVTRDGAKFITPVIRCLQSFADRVLVLVDDRTTDDTLTVARDLGAEALAVPLETNSYESALNVAVSLLNTEWVFYLHDDELVGPRFLAQLPQLLDSTQAWRFPHYNLYRSPDQYITTTPWYPDEQLRLIPRRMWQIAGGWPERVHASPAWACHVADCHIWHYKFLVKPQALRAERLAAWAREWGPADSPHYRAFSLPESFGDVQTEPVAESQPLQLFGGVTEVLDAAGR